MKVVEFTISCNNAYTTSYQSPCYNGIWHRVDAFYTHRKVAKNAEFSQRSFKWIYFLVYLDRFTFHFQSNKSKFGGKS